MSTGTDIIHKALENIGAHSIAAPADPETITRARDRLNSMMHVWLSRKIDLGFTPLNAPGDELSEPPDATNAIVDCLSLELAPLFDNGKVVVSQDLRANAAKGYDHVKAFYQINEIPNKVVSSTLPKGQGSWDTRYEGRYFGRGGSLNSENG